MSLTWEQISQSVIWLHYSMVLCLAYCFSLLSLLSFLTQKKEMLGDDSNVNYCTVVLSDNAT